MIEIRKADTRGQVDLGWLSSNHTFSFGHYYDPSYMGVSALRVINDDWVAPGTGFETHPHNNMEIVSYVLSGSIEHKDTMGFHSILEAGDIQVMSAGSGLMHSEFNASQSEPLNFLQIWIKPNQHNTEPSYAEKNIKHHKGISLIVSPEGTHESLAIKQDVRFYKIKLEKESAEFTAVEERTYYLQVAHGSLLVNGHTVHQGDGVTVNAETQLIFETPDTAEAVLIDLP